MGTRTQERLGEAETQGGENEVHLAFWAKDPLEVSAGRRVAAGQ